MKNSFNKYERLKGRKAVGNLFDAGVRFNHFPFKIVYSITTNAQAEIKVGISVSKRHFKRAVDRNMVKRHFREAWRVQKHDLLSDCIAANKSMHVFFIYIGGEIFPSATIHQKINTAISKLQTKINAYTE